MKIAISLTAGGSQALVSSRFGRCPYFMLYDTDTDEKEVFPNTSATEAGGAGTSAAQTIVDKGVRAVLSGRVGPKAFQVLSTAGVDIFLVKDGTSIEETVKLFKDGRLEKMEMKRF